MNKLQIISSGIVKNNPTFVLVLGMCPTLGTTTSAENGMGMGLATMAVFAGVVAMCSVSFDALPQAADGACSAGYKLGYLFGTAWRAGIFHVLAGGAMLGAIFMATDYSTSPMTVRGGVIFAVGIGLITMCIRLWGAYPEGMSFAILIMNACVPLINKYVKPKRFGVK